MLVQIRDRTALSSLSIVSLRSYLTSRDWKNEGPWGKRPAIIFAKEHGGRTWEILVPTRDTVADYAENMAESVAVLAEVEERSQLDVFHDLNAAGADVIQLRSANGMVDEPMSLRRSASLLKDAYDMLAASARAVEKPQPAYRGSMSSDVADYLDNVRPVPSHYQGYILTLHSPVPVGFGRQEDLGDDFHAPFSRRVTKTLARGLERTMASVEQVVADDNLEPFKKAVDYGVSANLCDSVAQLAKKGEGVAIDMTWAGVRPSDVPDSHYQFSPASADILVEAANSFRRDEPSYDERIIAQVVQLEREPHEFDGRATIISVRDRRPTRMRVEFDRSVYGAVINAFKEHASIGLDGDVHWLGSGYELRNPRNLSVLPD